tara:strand:- start:115 stop:1029 length:915 start_codon:yes stop_codon:yes gene_type:complete
MENTTMAEKEQLEIVEEEIKDAKRRAGEEDFEIEITDEPEADNELVAKQEPEKEEDPEYGEKVQKRIKKLVDQRREAELEAKKQQEQNAQLAARLERLEKGSQHQAENAFHTRYEQTKSALAKAIEEGDTQSQLDFSEQMADMRAAMRIAEMQKQTAQQQRTASPTVGRAQQAAENPAPAKAMSWWEKNRWFNSAGYERETAAARAIDVQLDLEGNDKNSEEYYDLLNNRLQKMFPELSSGGETNKPRVKSRSPVAPTAGGSQGYKGNRVRMSQDQLRMARELGITDEKGLKAYEAEIKRQARS